MKYNVTIQSNKAGAVIEVEATDEGDALQKGMDHINSEGLDSNEWSATSAQPAEDAPDEQ